MDQGRTLEKYVPVHNSIVIFGKSSLGGNLIVQLCIFSCKDKAMLGYNVLGMYLRTIGTFLLLLFFNPSLIKNNYLSAELNI